MSIISNRFKLTALSAAMLTAYGAANAQDIQEEELVVTGIRASIQQSVDDKRDAKNIVDTINSEDIGKTTDQNIADALSRVTGVSIVTRDGEGAQISVRGASPDQNNISLNGVQLTSTDFNSAVDLSAYSADILSKIEVVKTPSADHVEGSLGANVNLTSARPLETNEDVRSLTLEARHNPWAENTDQRISGTISQKLFDDQFGFILTAYQDTTTFRRDSVRVEEYETSDTIRVARDQDGNVIANLKAIEINGLSYDLTENTNDRWGFNAGFQLAASEKTDITLDVSYSNQETRNSSSQVRVRLAVDDGNFVAGGLAAPDSGSQAIAQFTDPQEDWWTVNTDTLTFTKKLSRANSGDLIRSVGGNQTDNYSAALKINHDFSDELHFEFTAGQSYSESKSLPSTYLYTQNTQVNARVLVNAGPVGTVGGIQPVGYDCSSGDCAMVVGTHIVDIGENFNNYIDENGDNQPGYADNIGLTGFNPSDRGSQGLGGISENDRTVKDKNSSVSADFDLDIDQLGITSLEFGARYSTRFKETDNQTYTFPEVTSPDVYFDEDGRPVALPGGGLNSIRASEFATTATPPSNFLESLDYPSNSASQGWQILDPVKALEITRGNSVAVRTADPGEYRSSDLDTSALYLKTNFSFFDERLTGDVGMRYVKTKLEANGFAGLNFFSYGQFAFERDFDLIKMLELRDTSLPECASTRDLIQGDWTSRGLTRDFRPYADVPATDPNFRATEDEYIQDFGGALTLNERKFTRVDGLGYFTPPNESPEEWTRQIPDQGACHDPVLAAWSAFHNDDTDTLEAPVQEDFDGRDVLNGWSVQWRYADVSTTHIYAWGDNWGKTTDPQGNTSPEQAGGFVNVNRIDRSTSVTPGSDQNEYSNILPSLNLNYLITDDIIARLALSKTMNRPRFEDTRAGFTFTEDMWAGENTILATNTGLRPLESKNVDIALEWYFSGSNLLAVTAFHKDQSNFTSNQNATVYFTDLRELAYGDRADETFDPSEIAILATGDASTNYGLEGCMPRRKVSNVFTANDDQNLAEHWGNDYRDLCAQTEYTQIINGEGATVSGLEFQYSQAFDFLPGVLSGLGTTMNYTYTQSEYDAAVNAITGRDTLTTPVAETPQHSYNATVYWEQDNTQVRLAYRGTSEALVGTDPNTGRSGANWGNGTLWRDGRDSLDISASYDLTDYASITFQATNVLDSETRTFYTSRTHQVVQYAGTAAETEYNDAVAAAVAAGTQAPANPDLDDDGYIEFQEGTPGDGATKGRTVQRYKNGTTFRLGVRLKF